MIKIDCNDNIPIVKNEIDYMMLITVELIIIIIIHVYVSPFSVEKYCTIKLWGCICTSKFNMRPLGYR